METELQPVAPLLKEIKLLDHLDHTLVDYMKGLKKGNTFVWPTSSAFIKTSQVNPSDS